VRYERSFRQTELSQALRVLSHAQSCLEQAKETIEDLEQEKGQIQSLRADITDQLDTLTEETWPDIERKKGKMLPEVRERLDALRQEFIAQRHKMETPSQVDYHKAREEWLPSLKSQLEEIISTHENDMEHYQRVARETERTLQRAWTRLEKMQPYEQPLPQEDVDELGAALESWHAEVKAEAESPSGLRALVGRRAAALQERMENAQSQIREGRRRLKELSKTYQRSAKTIHNLRSSIREIKESSQWPQIAWDTEDARDTWELAVALERQSATAPTLREASNQLQEAVNTAQKAKELYGHIENQMERALRQLDEEFRAVNKRLTRGRDRAATLEEEGASGEAEDIIEICDRGERRIEMATSASTFEDALRHLREARNILTRL
jgi:chromosome segregation ATPase